MEKIVDPESYDPADNGYTQLEPVVWKAETPGDLVKGVYTQKVENSGTYDSNVYHLVDGNAIWTVFGSTVIDRIMGLVSIGDDILIRFEGEAVSQNGQTVKLYTVHRRTGPPTETPEVPF